MKQGFLLILLFFLCLGTNSQVLTNGHLVYSNLSHNHIYSVTIIKKLNDHTLASNSKLTLLVLNQDKKIQQRISFNTGLLFEDAYTSNKNARSYVTGVNKDTEVSDYDFGDLIIADLNFDEKEDIAIKYDSGGNGGPVYNFYLQDKTGNFKLSKYLTNRVCSFPFYIDNRHKTIATQIHANVSQEGRKTFKYNPLTKKWRLVKWEMIGTKE